MIDTKNLNINLKRSTTCFSSASTEREPFCRYLFDIER